MSSNTNDVEAPGSSDNLVSQEEEPSQGSLNPLQASIASLVILGVSALLAWPLNTFIDAAIAFGMQWLVFAVHSYPFKSEKFYDLTGMFTFLAVSLYSFFGNQNKFTVFYVRNIIMTAMVIIWTLRLGSFLFARIQRAGEDDRFDVFKDSWLKFIMVWNIQGLWVFLITLPLQYVNSASSSASYPSAISPLDIVGMIVWAFGFGFEALADRQKKVWRADESNKGKWIDVGLWSISRHPNYFGEIVIWWGQFLMASAVFVDKPVGAISVLSPLYTMLLLIRVSGIPLLEAKSDKKWGGQDAYEEYKKNTPVLVPFCYCWH